MALGRRTLSQALSLGLAARLQAVGMTGPAGPGSPSARRQPRLPTGLLGARYLMGPSRGSCYFGFHAGQAQLGTPTGEQVASELWLRVPAQLPGVGWPPASPSPAVSEPSVVLAGRPCAWLWWQPRGTGGVGPGNSCDKTASGPLLLDRLNFFTRQAQMEHEGAGTVPRDMQGWNLRELCA